MAERQFGPYRLIRQIAVGGMAEIHLAKTAGIAGFEKYVALKMIHPNFAADDQFIQMLVDEAKIAVQLTHGNIAQTFDLGRVGDTYYITMEYVDGADLYKILRRASEQDREIPLDVCAFIGKEISSALDHAHRKRDHTGRSLGIVHRDVSPQNVLVSYSGEVKLVDFGIAKATMKVRQTAVGVIKGKYYYMSPEQAWGDPIDHRSDIFSAGIVLYEMITGQMLYLEEDLHKLLEMARTANIEPPSRLRRGVPPQLERIVMHALERVPGERYQSAGDFATDLERFLHAYSPVFTASKLSTLVREVVGDPLQVPDDPDVQGVEFRDGVMSTHPLDDAEVAHATDRNALRDENSVIFRVAPVEGAPVDCAPVESSPVGGSPDKPAPRRKTPPPTPPAGSSRPTAPRVVPRVTRPADPLPVADRSSVVAALPAIAPGRAASPPRPQVARPREPNEETRRLEPAPANPLHDDSGLLIADGKQLVWDDSDRDDGDSSDDFLGGDRTLVTGAPGMGFMIDVAGDGDGQVEATLITSAPSALGFTEEDSTVERHDDDAPTLSRQPAVAIDVPRKPMRTAEHINVSPPAALSAKIHAPAVSELRKPRPSRRTPTGGGVQSSVLHAIVSSQASEPMPSPRPPPISPPEKPAQPLNPLSVRSSMQTPTPGPSPIGPSPSLPPSPRQSQQLPPLPTERSSPSARSSQQLPPSGEKPRQPTPSPERQLPPLPLASANSSQQLPPLAPAKQSQPLPPLPPGRQSQQLPPSAKHSQQASSSPAMRPSQQPVPQSSGGPWPQQGAPSPGGPWPQHGAQSPSGHGPQQAPSPGGPWPQHVAQSPSGQGLQQAPLSGGPWPQQVAQSPSGHTQSPEGPWPQHVAQSPSGHTQSPEGPWPQQVAQSPSGHTQSPGGPWPQQASPSPGGTWPQHGAPLPSGQAAQAPRGQSSPLTPLAAELAGQTQPMGLAQPSMGQGPAGQSPSPGSQGQSPLGPQLSAAELLMGPTQPMGPPPGQLQQPMGTQPMAVQMGALAQSQPIGQSLMAVDGSGAAPGLAVPPGAASNPAGVSPHLAAYPQMQSAPAGYSQSAVASSMPAHGYPQMMPGALYQFQPPPQEMSLTGQVRLAEIDELPSHYKLGAARARWFTYIVSGVLAVSVAAAVTFLIIRSMRDSAPSVGSVYINSVPAGADVLFEGTRLRDKTPLTVDKVPVGTRPTIRIELAHYGPYEEILDVPRSGAEIKVMAYLRAITGKIIIDSVPPGAEIHINGRMRGRTPTTISDVDMDSAKQLQLRLKDYQLFVQDLVWPADGKIQINAKLVR